MERAHVTPGAALLASARRHLVIAAYCADTSRASWAALPCLENHMAMERAVRLLERAHVRLAWATEQREAELVDTIHKQSM